MTGILLIHPTSPPTPHIIIGHENTKSCSSHHDRPRSPFFLSTSRSGIICKINSSSASPVCLLPFKVCTTNLPKTLRGVDLQPRGLTVDANSQTGILCDVLTSAPSLISLQVLDPQTLIRNDFRNLFRLLAYCRIRDARKPSSPPLSESQC
jgi:hypothetical protein